MTPAAPLNPLLQAASVSVPPQRAESKYGSPPAGAVVLQPSPSVASDASAEATPAPLTELPPGTNLSNIDSFLTTAVAKPKHSDVYDYMAAEGRETVSRFLFMRSLPTKPSKGHNLTLDFTFRVGSIVQRSGVDVVVVLLYAVLTGSTAQPRSPRASVVPLSRLRSAHLPSLDSARARAAGRPPDLTVPAWPRCSGTRPGQTFCRTKSSCTSTAQTSWTR